LLVWRYRSLVSARAVRVYSLRRSNTQRTAEMRHRLLEATITCLVELGYARTSGAEVARRAGVSRGAQLYHYPTKQELVIAAVEHLFLRRNEEFLEAFARIPPGADRPAAALDLLWKIVGNDTFYAWLELAVAGRSDEKLGKRLRELGARTAIAVEQTFRDIFPAPPNRNPFYDTVPKFVFAVLQGLAIDRLLVTSPKVQAAEVLNLMKALSGFVFPTGGRKS
jgi:AcrR family transcriptional regulator